jgi:hypothetical protein
MSTPLSAASRTNASVTSVGYGVYPTVPRVLAEEPQRDVIGCPAPRLDREQLGSEPSHVRKHRHEVAGAHSGREQRLVRVAEGRLRHGEGLLLTQRGRETHRAELEEPLPRPRGGGGLEVDLREFEARADEAGAVAVRLVDGDLGEPVENLRPAVLGLAALHEPRPLLDERGAQVARHEVGIVEHGLEEGDVRRHAAQTELREPASSAEHSGPEVAAATGHLDEH